MPYEIFGRTNAAHGKTLWELLGNLKNHGVGRIVIRNQFQRYPEPTWYRILKVEALPVEGKIQVCPPVLDLGEVRRVRALVDNVFRGTYRGQEWLSWTTYKPDFRLIPKEEEESITKLKKGELPERFERTKVLPSHSDFPPLLRELIIQDMKANGTYKGEEPRLPLIYPVPDYKVAKEGETPSIVLNPDLGTPIAPRLYEDIDKVGSDV